MNLLVRSLVLSLVLAGSANSVYAATKVVSTPTTLQMQCDGGEVYYPEKTGLRDSPPRYEETGPEGKTIFRCCYKDGYLITTSDPNVMNNKCVDVGHEKVN